MDRDHPDKAHPSWVETSMQSAGNLVIGKTSAQNVEEMTVRKRGNEEGKGWSHM